MKSEKPMLTTGTEIALRKSQVGILVSYQANGFTYYLKDDPKKKHLYKGGHPKASSKLHRILEGQQDCDEAG